MGPPALLPAVMLVERAASGAAPEIFSYVSRGDVPLLDCFAKSILAARRKAKEGSSSKAGKATCVDLDDEDEEEEDEDFELEESEEEDQSSCAKRRVTRSGGAQFA